MGICQDCIDRLDAKRNDSNRIQREKAWYEAARLVYPQSPMSLLGGTAWPSGSSAGRTTAANRSTQIYDSTPITTARQLTNGIVSLMTPSTSYWHDMILMGVKPDDIPHEISEWLEQIRDYLFRVRYNPATGFANSNQAAIRQAVIFGNGFYRVMPHPEGNKAHPFSYRYLPLMTTYISVTAENVHDETDEIRHLTARQAVKSFGEDKVSGKVLDAANDPQNTQQFEFLHSIHPRDDRSSSGAVKSTRNSKFASYIIETDTKHMIEESGFFEFPDVKYGWEDEPNQAYSTGPVEMILATIKQQNAMAKSMVIGGQNTVEPAYLTAANPVGGHGMETLPRLDTRPNAMNSGYLDQNGRPLAVPLNAVKDPSWAQGLMEDGRKAIREGLFMHLFQVLQDNPNQSATEALIREQEKGELLGPVGQSIQSGLSSLVDREVGILDRMGVFDAELIPPMDVGEVDFSPEYTSPLDKARKASQVLGMQRSVELAMPLAEVDPTIMENFDFHEMVRTATEILGAPKKILKSEKERDAAIQKQQQMQEMQQQMAMMQQGGQVAQQMGAAVNEGAAAVQNTAGSIPAGQQIAQLLGGGEGGNPLEEQSPEASMIDLDPNEFAEVEA